MKAISLISTLSAAAAVSASACGCPRSAEPLPVPVHKPPPTYSPYPTTKLAGLEVIDTRIVRDARKLISSMTAPVFKHQMRSWLYGVAIIQANETLSQLVDLEAHAIATMLHDLGWDMSPDSPFTTPDHRFEVDGANGARRFIQGHPDGGEWDQYRVQRVWDAIALHTSLSISAYKELDVATIVESIGVDYNGPERGITQEVYDGIVAEFPNDDLFTATNDTFIWFCQTKPNVTYDNAASGWGLAFVPGYTLTGHQFVDMFYGNATAPV